MQPHDTTSIKRCSKCGATKPLSSFYIRKSGNSIGKPYAHCISCHAAMTAAARLRNPERHKRRCREYSQSHQEERRAYREANREEINERKRAWWAANREEISERRRAHYAANREEISERRRAHYAANREEISERRRTYDIERGASYMRAWRSSNKERIAEYNRAYREANKEYESERNRAWRIANPEKVKVNMQRRRARERGAEGTHTAEDIQAQYKRQKGRCYWCDEKVGKDYHVDHVVPLSRGGTNWPENLVVACPTCNVSKGDRLPHEWACAGRLL